MSSPERPPDLFVSCPFVSSSNFVSPSIPLLPRAIPTGPARVCDCRNVLPCVPPSATPVEGCPKAASSHRFSARLLRQSMLWYVCIYGVSARCSVRHLRSCCLDRPTTESGHHGVRFSKVYVATLRHMYVSISYVFYGVGVLMFF